VQSEHGFFLFLGKIRMNFFGLTHLGPQSAFSYHVLKNVNINDFSDDLFINAFQKLDKDKANVILQKDIRELLDSVYGHPPPEEEVSLFVHQFKAISDEKNKTRSERQKTMTVTAMTMLSDDGDRLLTKNEFLSALKFVKENRPKVSLSDSQSISSSSTTTLSSSTTFSTTTPTNTLSLTSNSSSSCSSSSCSSSSSQATEFTSHKLLKESKNKYVPLKYHPQEKFRVPLTSSQEYGWFKAVDAEKVEALPKNSCPETVYASEMVKSGIYF